MKLLVVEDEIKTGEYVRQCLMESGFMVDLARTGLDGHHLALTEPYDLIILDVMLPDVDGWRIVQALREAKSATPVRSEEHTSELQSLMRISYAVFCLTKKKTITHITQPY